MMNNQQSLVNHLLWKTVVLSKRKMLKHLPRGKGRIGLKLIDQCPSVLMYPQRPRSQVIPLSGLPCSFTYLLVEQLNPTGNGISCTCHPSFSPSPRKNKEYVCPFSPFLLACWTQSNLSLQMPKQIMF